MSIAGVNIILKRLRENELTRELALSLLQDINAESDEDLSEIIHLVQRPADLKVVENG